MKQLFYILIILFVIRFNPGAQTQFTLPDSTRRILFLGNSITYSGQYICYIEACLTIRHPSEKWVFINAGLPSETVSGLSEPHHAGGNFPRPDLHERLDRVLTQVDPDLIFACYGMNDGIYMNFDDTRFQKYREGIQWLHDQAIKSGALIVFLTPPIFDERKGESYARVLDIYSDWLLSCRDTKKWNVVDIHWPMKEYLAENRLSDSTFYLAKDGIHPNDQGHWIMAKQVLLFLGESHLKNADNANLAVSPFSHGERILELVVERQQLMKDAWLTSIGHQRPGMPNSLPLDRATSEADKIEKQIRTLIKHKD